jgi:hypothetical protein
MTIGSFSTGLGNQNVTQFGLDFNEHKPTGQLDDAKGNSFHLPFSRQAVHIEKKINYNVIPEIAGHYHDQDYNNIPLNKTNPTIAVFNNLYNFNPTHREMSYYHPHETDKLFHHNISRPRFETEILRDTSIPDEINAIKKDNAVDAHKLPEHSFTIKRRART